MKPIRPVLLAGLLVGCKPTEPPEPPPTPTPVSTPVATPTPASTPFIARKPMDVAMVFNGLSLTNSFHTPQGVELASVDRREESAYQVSVSITARLPRASTTVEDLAANDPKLPHVLNDFAELVAGGRLSPWFAELYERKVDYVRARTNRLDQILSRHNFYDCETILEWRHPATGRRAVLFVGDMDVNTDGSDGDRNFEVDGSSVFFQPQTSFRWRKVTERANPFLAKFESRLEQLKADYAVKGLSAEKNRELREGIEATERTLYDLRTWSFLISDADPFIVVPGFVLKDEASEFTPKVGDYAVVIFGGVIYPALVGDAGPSFKMGEASMRLCRALNPRASANSRPVSDLTVAYLVFPGTADPSGPPDLGRWQDRCKALIDEIGGSPTALHVWENIVPPWPTPTPEPTPEATPGASVEGPVIETSPPPVPAVIQPADAVSTPGGN
jgi:hypothetical protein